MKKIKIIIVDDHQIVGEALSALINSQPDMLVAGVADNAEQFFKIVNQHPYDLALIDLSLPDQPGLELIKRLNKTIPSLKLVIMTGYRGLGLLTQGFYCGAAGYLCKQSGAEVMLQGIRAVAAGHLFIDPSMAGDIQKQNDDQRRLTRFHNRGVNEVEEKLLRFLAWGLDLKQIANLLDIPPARISYFKSRSMRKLSLKNRQDLIRYAVQVGWMNDL